MTNGRQFNEISTIFYNSDYIVIEYIDLIKSPYLILLDVIRKNDKIREILKIEQIEFLDNAALYEWYINRKHQNFLIDLNRYPDKISEETLDILLEDQIDLTSQFYQKAVPLILTDMLKIVKQQKLTKGIIIYHPHHNDYAEKDMKSFVNGNFIFMDDWDKVMEKAGSNSTYFISDIRKIQKMKEKGVLKFSSVTLPIEYRYNKKNMEDFDMDFEELFKTDTFKLTYCSACTLYKPINIFQ